MRIGKLLGLVLAATALMACGEEPAPRSAAPVGAADGADSPSRALDVVVEPSGADAESRLQEVPWPAAAGGSAVSAFGSPSEGTYQGQGACIDYDYWPNCGGFFGDASCCDAYEHVYRFCPDVDDDEYGSALCENIARYEYYCEWWNAFGDACAGDDGGVERAIWQQRVASEAWGPVTLTDCNDGRADINPGVNERCQSASGDAQPTDYDCDGGGYTDRDNATYTYTSQIGGSCPVPGKLGRCSIGYRGCTGAYSAGCVQQYSAIAELCNGEDDDCDGAFDEGIATTYYLDNDGDGYGATAVTWSSACSPPSNYKTVSGDCNDANTSIRPGAAELCDGVNNDCNAGTNDGTADPVVGTGCAVAGGLGRCNAGAWACSGGALTCVSTNAPIAETCSNMNEDSNCDGVIDNIAGLGDACDDGDADACNDGMQACVGAALACTESGFASGFDFFSDVGTTVYDVSGSNRHGTATGTPAPAWTADGRVGGGFEFYGNGGRDGGGNPTTDDDRLTIGTGGVSNTEGSLAMWVRPGFNGTDNGIHGLFQTSQSINSPGYIAAFRWAGTSFFQVVGGPGQINQISWDSATPNHFVSGEWTHWVFTWSSRADLLAVYRNGALVASRTGNIWPTFPIADFAEVGRGYDRTWVGRMDDVALYGVAFNAAQALALYSAGELSPGGWSGNDPGGQNLELCDNVDNDCRVATADGATDPRVGGSCDSPDDTDACTDDVWTCSAGGIICQDVGGSSVEICNAADDDCDGLYDEGPALSRYIDADLDAYGTSAVVWASVCPVPANYATVDGDCDDTRSDVYPSAPELCDGRDNDCNTVVDDGVPGVGVACSLGYSGPAYCDAGVQVCSDGSLYCQPTAFDYGDQTTVTVAAGLLNRATGEVEAGTYLMTADEAYAYSVAYSFDGGTFNGWKYRVYNPRNAWSLVAERTVAGTSFHTEGVVSDGTYLYMIEWTGAAGARVHRLRMSDGTITTGPFVNAPFIAGQLDASTSRVYLGSATSGQVLGFAAGPWSPPGGMLPAGPSLPAGPATVSGTSGLGALATDGVYMFAKQFAPGYPGSTTVARVETGEGGTTFGQFAGQVGTALSGSHALFEFDGHVFSPSGPTSLERLRVSPALMETCNDVDDNCNGTVDDAGADGCVVYFRDVDGDNFGVTGDTRCLCDPDSVYRAAVGGDCDDANADAHPGGTDVAASGTDEDCDGFETCYVDFDQDGWRTEATVQSPLVACPTSSGLATAAAPSPDCDDDEPFVNADQPETCNGRDDDCDVAVDETFTDLFDACDILADAADCASGFRVCNGAGTATVCSPPNIAAFGFDGAAGTSIGDGASHEDITLHNGASWAVGQQRGGLRFDGADDYARGATWGAWSGLDAMTISAWVNPDFLSGPRVLLASAGTGDGMGCCWRWRLMLRHDGRIEFEVNDGDNSTITSTDPIAVGAWSHVTATLKVGGVNRLYVNGAPSGGTSTVTSNTAWGYPIIGAELQSGSPDKVFGGAIDEVRIVPAELDASAVAAFFAAGGTADAQATREVCDGLDNDCTGGADDGIGVAAGTTCDGDDLDTCLDGAYTCTADLTATTCRMTGPRLFWDFDVVSGTARNVAGPAYGADGNLTLFGTTLEAGRDGDALRIAHGATYGTLADSAATQIGGRELTLAAWIHPDTLAFSGTHGMVVSKESAFQIGVRGGSGEIECAIQTSQRGWFWTGAHVATVGDWQHVACTLGADGLIRTYVDGVERSVSSYVGGVVASGSGTLRVGGRAASVEPFAGLIDDVGVWERALSAADLALVMASGPDAVIAPGTAGGRNLELCDGADNNCDGAADETFVFQDPQGAFAGVGDACDGADADFCGGGAVLCAASLLATTCDDDPATSSVETCNEADDDCDGDVDEGLPTTVFYRDADGDGYGNPDQQQGFCALPSAGWSSNAADCADSSAAVHPLATEVCDGVDNNCDGLVDNSPLPGEGGGACVADGALGACQTGTATTCQSATTVSRTESDATHGKGFVGDWLLIGPFYWSTSGDPCASQPAAQPFSTTSTPAAGEVVAGKTWWRHTGLAEGGACNGGWGVPFNELYPDSPWFASYYAATYVHSPATRIVDLSIGYDDNARVWLNGALVFSATDCDCFETDEVLVQDVTLVAGENVLLIENGNVSFDMGFVARFLQNDGEGTAACTGQSATDQCPVTDLWITTEPGRGVMGCDAGTPAGSEHPCNGLDDDCDGTLAPGEADADSDGQAACAGDCDDSNPNVFLGATEGCDYADNDCDGRVDEGFGVGTACDSDDTDTCEDGRTICDPGTGGTTCANGATLLLAFEEDGATAWDWSGDGNDATVEPPAEIILTNARHGFGSVQLAGGTQSAVRVPMATAQSSPEFTFAAWVYPTASGARGILSALDASGVGNALLVGTSTWLHMNGQVIDPDGFAAVPTNAWTHVAVTYGGGRLTMYHNGAVVSGPWPVAVSPTASFTSDLFVGQELDAGGTVRDGCPDGCSTDPSQAFIGFVDDVAWYTYPLSSTEVASLSAAFPSVDVNLELCDWRDNDCDAKIDEGYIFGDSISDFVDNGDGTFTAHVCATVECMRCDGADEDACRDAVHSCTASGRATECSWGAVSALDFDRSDSPSRFLDLAGNSAHGLRGTQVTTAAVDGRDAAVFNGTTNARVSVDGAAGWRPSFTVSFWARPDDASAAPETLVSRFTEFAMPGGTCLSQRGFEITRSGDILWNCRQLRVNALRDAFQVATPEWVHVTVTHDGSALRAFVNGAQVAIRSDHTGAFVDYASISTPQFGPIRWNSHIWLGQRQTVPNGGFTATAAFEGAMDDFMWVDFPLTGTEVAQLHASGLPGVQVNYEFCDGLDNNCRDADDETFTTLGDLCSGGLGACLEPGTEVCSADGMTTQCSATGLPGAAEVCDNVDNDCDGNIDNGLARACSTACGPGVETCSAGVWGGCTAPGSSAEVCDEVDNDCDGNIDELPFYGCGVGACFHFQTACVGGVEQTCDPFEGAQAERCDNIDWDCDGNPNNGFPVGGACGASSGTCSGSGVFVCSPDGSGVVCDTSGGGGPPVEICGNSADDDCDLAIDETDVTGSVTVTEVAIGSPSFDYGRCEILAGSGPRCAAVVFRVTNTSATPISATETATAFSSVGGVRTDRSAPTALGRPVAPGTTEEFVMCWSNAAAAADVAIGVALDGACTGLSGQSATSDYRLGVCGGEVCDGIDNNADTRVDELPDACGGNSTLRCVNDPRIGNWVCVPLLTAETGCADVGCPVGQTCVGDVCVEGCDTSEQCPGSTVCVDGVCAVRAAAPEPEVVVAEPGEPDGVDASPPATTADNSEDVRDGGLGCATSQRTSPGAPWWVALAAVALFRRRRASVTPPAP